MTEYDGVACSYSPWSIYFALSHNSPSVVSRHTVYRAVPLTMSSTIEFSMEEAVGKNSSSFLSFKEGVQQLSRDSRSLWQESQIVTSRTRKPDLAASGPVGYDETAPQRPGFSFAYYQNCTYAS